MKGFIPLAAPITATEVNLLEGLNLRLPAVNNSTEILWMNPILRRMMDIKGNEIVTLEMLRTRHNERVEQSIEWKPSDIIPH